MAVGAASTGRIAGVLCALGASVCFSLNDVAIKLLSGDYPLHQIVFTRALVAIALTLAIIVPLEGGYGNLRTRRPLLHLARGVCVVFANMAFFTALAAMPIADATAIFFVAPLLITGLSVLILGEIVGLRRWLAVIAGLAGVAIVVQPTGEGFRMAALLPLASALAYALLQILTRRVGLTEKASTMAFYIQLTFIVVSAGFGLAFGDGALAVDGDPSLRFLFGAWVWPPARDLAAMAVIGVISAAGGYLVTQAYRISEAGLVAPFEYTALVLAIVWGFAIWGELPTPMALVGMAIILVSGLYLALREALAGARLSVRRVSARR